MAGNPDNARALEAFRAAESPRSGPAFTAFYKALKAHATWVLRSFPLRAAEPEDLFQDTVAAVLEEILDARDPFRLLTVAVGNRAKSWMRLKRNQTEDGMAAGDDGVDPKELAVDHHVLAKWSRDEAPDIAFVLDARKVLASLRDDHREIVIAVAEGEDREALAKVFGTSRGNIDQIVSRVRRSLSDPRRSARLAGNDHD